MASCPGGKFHARAAAVARHVFQYGLFWMELLVSVAGADACVKADKADLRGAGVVGSGGGTAAVT